jgi:hypothetical protein
MYLQFGLRTSLAIVAGSAGLLAIHVWLRDNMLPIGWWDVKPVLSIIYLPLAVWIVLNPSRLRRFGLALFVGCGILQVLWLDLRRPNPSQVMLGPWINYPMAVIAEWLNTAGGKSSFVFRWFVHYGTVADEMSIVYPILIFPLVALRAASSGAPVVAAIGLCLLRIVDWVSSGTLRFGWTPMEVLDINHNPARLAAEWLRGERTGSGTLRLFTWVGALELIVVTITLSGVLIITIQRRRKLPSGLSFDVASCPEDADKAQDLKT